MDVPDSRVQWGRFSRMRVRLDVSKRLVHGKKIIVEGGECQWVNFKYKRLPNFYYRCGLLSHALKDCPENNDYNNQIENMELQYRAWMRGEIIRRNLQEPTKLGMGKGDVTRTRQCTTGVELERRTKPIRMSIALARVGGAHKSRVTSMEHSPLTKPKAKGGLRIRSQTSCMKKEGSMGWWENKWGSRQN